MNGNGYRSSESTTNVKQGLMDKGGSSESTNTEKHGSDNQERSADKTMAAM